MRKGYLTPPVLIILALITFFVAITLFFNTNLLKNIKNQPTPSTQPQPSPTPDASREPNGSAETENWKTYTNETFGFSLKYPPVLSSIQSGGFPNAVLILRSPIVKDSPTEPLMYIISVDVFDNPSNLSVGEWIEKDRSPKILQSIKREKISVGGQIGERVIDLPSQMGTVEVYISKDDKIYSFMLQPFDEEKPFKEQAKYQGIFDQILSTFQFID